MKEQCSTGPGIISTFNLKWDTRTSSALLLNISAHSAVNQQTLKALKDLKDSPPNKKLNSIYLITNIMKATEKDNS